MAVNDGDVIKVVQTISMPESVIGQNVYYYQLDDSVPDNPSNAQITTAVETALEAMHGEIDQDISNDFTFGDFSVERVEWNVDKWETVENVGTGDINEVGEAAGDSLPHGVAAVCTAQTNRPQTRARKFIPGFTDSGTTGSTWTAAVLAALAAYVLEWLSTQGVVGAAELVPVVLGQSGPSAGLIYPLIGAAVSSIAGYQRRRKPGVGA